MTELTRCLNVLTYSNVACVLTPPHVLLVRTLNISSVYQVMAVTTYVKYDVLAVVGFKPPVASFEFLMPLDDGSLRDLNQNGIVQLRRLALLLQLRCWKVFYRIEKVAGTLISLRTLDKWRKFKM